MINLFNRIGQYQFSTIVSEANGDLFKLEQFSVLNTFYSTRNFFSLSPVVFVADPFLFVHNEELFLFYEEQIELTGKGVIKMVKTSDLKEWSKPITVLEEDYHLSFPNVFLLDGQIYMMPESGNDKCIKLYTPNENLSQWIPYKTILEGSKFIDSSIVRNKNKLFLFTTDYTNQTNKLRLFYSNCIDDLWVEHPLSPIVEGKDIGRCAGSLFNYQEKLYRPCQLTSNRYGEGVDLYEVLELTCQDFKEKKNKKLIPNSNKIYSIGGHHFNYCYFKNKKIVATDILELRFNFWEVIRRIIAKLKQE
jgi:hypothetical protein